jgi:hypothetical protein
MITINFYENGYETTGHASNEVCGQISSMQYIIEGVFLNLSESTKCYDGEEGDGYTILYLEDEELFPLFDGYKEDFKTWCESEFEEDQYSINEFDGKLRWKNRKINKGDY